jgi:cellulose synthase/poly-beta-1,6-N-acetylglucosamine synthase-like glycosyltransferase
VSRLIADLPAGMRILVVADNCSDDTAAIARAAGAEAVERHDLERRGKGYALAFGRDQLAAQPPEAVIVLDADCWAEPGALAALASAAIAEDAPVQACDLLRPVRGSPLVEISTFAFAVKNRIRQLGLQRLGAPAILAGTGMAFPWRIFSAAPLATASLAEDLDLGIDLLRAGERPLFLATARVWSEPGDAVSTLGQRSRWESGFLATARRRALPTLARGITRPSWGELWTGLHLMTPPLALLGLANLLAMTLAALAIVAGATLAPLAALGATLILLALGLAGAWVKLGTDFLSPSAAIRLPAYMLWKLPMYARLLVRRGPRHWVRAARPTPGSRADEP